MKAFLIVQGSNTFNDVIEKQLERLNSLILEYQG